MKKVKFFPSSWQTFPYTLESNNWDKEGRLIKDLVLKNSYATKKGVSEMILNISKLSVFNKEGKEQFVADFQGQNEVNLKGMHTGRFIRSQSILKLEPGDYTTIRFYLNKKGNSFSYTDRTSESVYRFKYLDFEIENEMKLTGDEASQVILRFDFEPFDLSSYFRPFLQFFERSRSLTARFSNSLGL